MSIADRFKNGITRRGFVLGGAATGAAAVLAGCSKKTGTSDDAAGEPQVIKDDSKIVSDRKSTRLNSSHSAKSRMPSSA